MSGIDKTPEAKGCLGWGIYANQAELRGFIRSLSIIIHSYNVMPFSLSPSVSVSLLMSLPQIDTCLCLCVSLSVCLSVSASAYVCRCLISVSVSVSFWLPASASLRCIYVLVTECDVNDHIITELPLISSASFLCALSNSSYHLLTTPLLLYFPKASLPSSYFISILSFYWSLYAPFFSKRPIPYPHPSSSIL